MTELKVVVRRDLQRGLLGVGVGLWAVGLGACESDPNIDRVPSSGFFMPEFLDFGVVGVGETKELKTTFRNTSGASMTVLDVGYDPDNSAYVVRDENMGTLPNLTLRPGSAEDLTVRCSPPAEGDFGTTLLLAVQDREIELPLRAIARILQPARPVLEPASVTFQEIEVGRDVSQRITIRNAGDLPGALKLIKSREGPFSMTAVGGGLLAPNVGVLDPGEAYDLELHFRPADVARATAELTVELGDESAVLQASGTGQVPGELSCNTSALAFGSVPRGTAVRRPVVCQATGGPYALAAIRFAPGSSSVFKVPAFPAGLDQNRQFGFEVEVDAVGLPDDHLGRVEIVAAHGAVVGIGLSARVEPPLPGSTDLSLSLSWNSTGTDFDLHLVRSGRDLFSEVDDCYFQNKNPDWGAPGDGGDDPYLDRDDTDGFGPEALNLSRVGEVSYDAYVQFFNYAGTTPPTTTAFLTIESRGNPTRMLQADIFGCGDTWVVGRFTVSGGNLSFTPAGQIVDTYRSMANVKCR
jgi:hypothetical protein